MRVVFIIGQGAVGGIETYCLRMCRALRSRGVDLEIWIVKHRLDADLVREMEKVACVRFLTHPWMPYPLFLKAPRMGNDVDLIVSTGRLSLLSGAASIALSGRPHRLVAGVFSQSEYAQGPKDYKSALSLEVIEAMGPDNVVFCTEGCRADHAEAMGEAFSNCLVSPLLVDCPSAVEPVEGPTSDPLRIVSIGNFTPFKTSHFQLPGVVRQLVDAGVAVEWTLYGDGRESDRIRRAIQLSGTEKWVRLAGRIPYSDMRAALAEADLYVGAGTTLIEASALGVPALVALDDNPEPTTPGFFCDRPGVYTSDRREDDALEPFDQAIRRFAELDREGRLALRERSILRARKFSTDNALHEIQAMISRAKPIDVSISGRQFALYTVGTIIELAHYILTGKANVVR